MYNRMQWTTRNNQLTALTSYYCVIPCGVAAPAIMDDYCVSILESLTLCVDLKWRCRDYPWREDSPRFRCCNNQFLDFSLQHRNHIDDISDSCLLDEGIILRWKHRKSEKKLNCSCSCWKWQNNQIKMSFCVQKFTFLLPFRRSKYERQS